MSTSMTVMPGDSITFGTSPPEPTPSEVVTFLKSRQWNHNSEGGWMREWNYTERFTWEQAVAIEFMNFITLGGVQTR